MGNQRGDFFGWNAREVSGRGQTDRWRRTPRLEAGVVLDARQRPSWPLSKGARAHERRMSPASVEIASSRFATTAGPGRPGGVLLDVFSMTDLLSLLWGGVSRRVTIARTTLRRQVRGLDSLFAIIGTPQPDCAKQAVPLGTRLFRSVTHVSSTDQRRCDAASGVPLGAGCLTVPKTGGIDSDPHPWYKNSRSSQASRATRGSESTNRGKTRPRWFRQIGGMRSRGLTSRGKQMSGQPTARSARWG